MHNKPHRLLLGAHISISGGLENAFSRGESIGCTALQIFTKNNRQWTCKPITKEEIATFKNRWQNSSIQSIVVHAAYLINIASAQPETVAKSLRALKEELLRCEQLGIPYLILHPGSNNILSKQESLTQIAKQLDEVIDAIPGNTMILLETMAGQGSNLCSQFEELATVYKSLKNKNRVGICFDTCHAFAAGYDMREKQSYEKMWKQFDEIIGLELLKVIHVNDSKKELGSRVDRHEHIGKGAIGDEAFRLLFNDDRFTSIPKILETPKENLDDDLKNMQKIVTLLQQKTKDKLNIKGMKESFEAKSKQ